MAWFVPGSAGISLRSVHMSSDLSARFRVASFPRLFLTLFMLVCLAALPLSGCARPASEGAEPTGQATLVAPDKPEEAAVPEDKPADKPARKSPVMIQVNYAHDFISGSAAGGSIVRVLWTGAEGESASAEATLDDHEEFFLECGRWVDGACPDIRPGDRVEATAEGIGSALVDPVGEIVVTALDAAADLVVARVEAPLGEPVQALCQVWADPAPEPIVATVDSKGGELRCDFREVGYDLQAGTMVAVMYDSPDGNTVITVPEWPWRRASITDDSVGANVAAGTVDNVVVLDAGGSVKASARAESLPGGGWGGDGYEVRFEDWRPAPPDIVAGDQVLFGSGGVTTTLAVGDILAELDLEANSVSGTVRAPGEGNVSVECSLWGEAWDAHPEASRPMAEVRADGADPFVCAWDPAEVDLDPTYEIDVQYMLPNRDMVLSRVSVPFAHLRLSPYSAGAVAPGGGATIDLHVWNEGNLTAEAVTLTGELDGLTYLGDSRGAGEGSPLVWDLGALAPGEEVRLVVFAGVPRQAATGSQVAARFSLSTDTTDRGRPEEQQGELQWTVEASSSDLNVFLGKWTDMPTPGEDMVYNFWICNQGSTGTEPVTLESTLSEGLTLQEWWSDSGSWQEESSAAGKLVLALPAMNGYGCDGVYVRAQLAETMRIGDQVRTTVRLTAAGDKRNENNTAEHTCDARNPFANVAATMALDGGVLVPGGEMRVNVALHNEGNTAAVLPEVRVMLPEGARHRDTWLSTPRGGAPYAPDAIEDGRLVWREVALAPGAQIDFTSTLSLSPEARPGDPLVSAVEVAALEGELRTDDNRVEVHEALLAGGADARLALTSEWRDYRSIHCRLRFDNLGDAVIPSAEIRVPLPEGLAYHGDSFLTLDQRLTDGLTYDEDARVLALPLREVPGGTGGWLEFTADLDEGSTPGQILTVRAEIAPFSDGTPADNVAEATLQAGGEVGRVEFSIRDDGPSSANGHAEPGTTVTAVPPNGSADAFEEPACKGCWQIDDLGPLSPGDRIVVRAGEGLVPVELTVPDPLSAVADAAAGEITGEVGGRPYAWVEVHGDWDGRYRDGYADEAGRYRIACPGIPEEVRGYLRYEERVGETIVVWHAPLQAGGAGQPVQ